MVRRDDNALLLLTFEFEAGASSRCAAAGQLEVYR